MRHGGLSQVAANESNPSHHHEKIKPFAKVLIALECPYSTFSYNFRYLLGPKGSFVVGMDPFTWTYYTHISVFICSILAVLLGVISDSYFTKYITLLFGFLFCLISSVILFIAYVVHLGNHEKLVNTIALFWMCSYQIIEPLRVGLFFDQLPSHMAPHQAGHVFLMYQEMKTLGSIIYIALNSLFGSKVYGETTLTLSITYLVIPILYTIVILGFYKIVNRGQTSYAVGIDCITCFIHALNLRFVKGEKSEGHWLDASRDAFDARTVRNTKIMSSIIFIYLTLISYGMTSLLMKNTWTDQAKNLIEDVDIKKFYIDVSMIYFVLTILFLPLIEYFILPTVGKYRKPLTELQRIGITVFVTGLSFILTTTVQLNIEKFSSMMPSKSYAQVRIFNTYPFDVIISANWSFPPTRIPAFAHIEAWNVRSEEISLYTLTVEDVESGDNFTALLATVRGESVSYLIGPGELLQIKGYDPILFGPPGTNKDDHVRVYVVNYDSFGEYPTPPLMPRGKHLHFTSPKHEYTALVPQVGNRHVFQVMPGKYEVTCPKFKMFKCAPSTVAIQRGGLYAILPILNNNGSLTFKAYVIMHPAVFSIAIIVPQIAILSFAEAMGKIPINLFMFKESPLETRVSSIALYYFFRDSTAIIFAIFHEVFRFQVDSFQLVLVTGIHLVFCFLFVYAALRHHSFPEEGQRRRLALLGSN